MEMLSPSRGRLLACYVSFVAIGLLLAGCADPERRSAVREAMKLPKRIVRVHDVAQTRQFILVQQAVRIHRAARLRGQA